MSQPARFFSTRNVMGIVLIAGIGAGIYLGDFMKGPGFGGSSNSANKGTGADGDGSEKVSSKKTTETTEPKPEKTAAAPLQTPVVKIVVSDRAYLLRTATGDEPIELDQIVSYATAAKGDEDGVKIRVYRKPSSRASTEIALQQALTAAGVGEEQTVWVVNPVDE